MGTQMPLVSPKFSKTTLTLNSHQEKKESIMTERHLRLVRMTRNRHAQPKGAISVGCVNGCTRCICQLAQLFTFAKA